MVQFCIQGKASALAEERLSPLFSIETQVICTKELVGEDLCHVFDDSVNFVTDLCAVARNPPFLVSGSRELF
jgi:hypothetical protein